MSQHPAPAPSQDRPLSPLAYAGYALLFLIPGLGLIPLLYFSIKGGNPHRRNFARSFWIVFLAGLLLLALLAFQVISVLNLHIKNLAEFLAALKAFLRETALKLGLL